ncbi:hypothetical protein [Streptomyces lichenis]|uniref:Uncharacterized protein n=1 Tax=Streptomyces lichenis TaxID=2306967 RepID=A0ABT0ICU2_9ACTN|nr:hypothetical protein [Streptomyces lichenis]MCK8679149.1 hypothetical protein [Streptomyces lichenis]
MIRNAVGSLLALVGAAAAVWSPFLAWYNGRAGRDYAIADLFGGITGNEPAPIASLLLPFAFAALLTLFGIVLRSRLLVGLAGLVVLGFTVLWMVRQGQAADSLSIEPDGTGLGWGVGAAAAGGLLLLLAAALMSGRRGVRGRRRARREREELPEERYGEPYRQPQPQPYEQQPQPYEDQYGGRPAPYDPHDPDAAQGRPGPYGEQPPHPGQDQPTRSYGPTDTPPYGQRYDGLDEHRPPPDEDGRPPR